MAAGWVIVLRHLNRVRYVLRLGNSATETAYVPCKIDAHYFTHKDKETIELPSLHEWEKA
jgi:hypothetical protein